MEALMGTQVSSLSEVLATALIRTHKLLARSSRLHFAVHLRVVHLKVTKSITSGISREAALGHCTSINSNIMGCVVMLLQALTAVIFLLAISALPIGHIFVCDVLMYNKL